VGSAKSQYRLRVMGIAGSLRAASYSKIVLGTIERLLPHGVAFDSLDIGSLPHYNEEVEHEAVPQSVAAGRERVAASDAVIIVTPEYNHGLPGVLKNTLDWLSRPAFASCMNGKPVLFVTLSPGALGGVRAQGQLRETLSAMMCSLIPMPEMAITSVATKIEAGQLADRPTLDFVAGNLTRFLSAVAAGAADR
jgi:chromate reductase, NAD(P)H dehydrogenase (quinone)